LMTWNAAVHYTQVAPDTLMVRCAAPWFSWTCSAPGTLPAALQGEPASAFASRQVRLLWASLRYLVAKQLPRFSAEPLAAFHSLLAFGLTSRSRCFHAGSILVKAHIQSENDDRTVGKGLGADRGKNEITDLGNKHLHGFASLNWTPE
jgi:hypothetical protein